MNLLSIRDLGVSFPRYGGWLRRPIGEIRAVDGVSLEVARGEVLGIVGESGSGKTTLGRAVANLVQFAAPDARLSGSIRYDGQELNGAGRAIMAPYRRKIQVVFQDPHGSLNPRMTVGQNVRGPHEVALAPLLERVGLTTDAATRYPHELSGGQRQRVGIARALAPNPELLVADEPVSALDVSVQAQVLNLLADLRAERGLTMLFVAHDLAVVRYIADRIAVMVSGRIVELGGAEQIWAAPRHPYTRALWAAIPRVGVPRERAQIAAEPSRDAATGCVFHPRCPIARPECAREVPALREVAPGHSVACPYTEG